MPNNLANTTALPPSNERSLLIMGFIAALFLIGLAARLSPFLDVEGRLYWQYMTEDGYLMQTVARNMAIGLGMSTAEGTLLTNGVQPLATYLFAGLHVLAGGDKLAGIALVSALSTVVALGSAVLLGRVGEKVFAHSPHGWHLAWVAAGLWFAAPLITRHSMNGLETGLYHAALMLTMVYFLQHFCTPASHSTWGKRLMLGFLLGLTFLARNDAVFFIAALLAVHLLVPVPNRNDTIGNRFITCVVAGLFSIVVASPWLINNYLGFGSIVPISGTAQSFSAEVGRNLPWVAAHLFENTWLWFPIPSSLETRLPVQLVAALATLAALFIHGRWVAPKSAQARAHFFIGLLFTAALVTYYGLFFGANWFLPRYFSAASPFLWLFVFGGIVALVQNISPLAKVRKAGGLTALAGLTVMAAAFAANDFRTGTQHMHKQVVEWTRDNVAPEVWVGAPQTGTLGYFHDRTINLDGKVNPGALKSLLEHGHILHYTLESPVQYVVDWVGLAQWVNMKHQSERFGEVFEVVVEDPARNLAVLRRKP